MQGFAHQKNDKSKGSYAEEDLGSCDSKDKDVDLLCLGCRVYQRTFGGTPDRDPCSLWGLIYRLPRDIGVI